MTRSVREVIYDAIAAHQREVDVELRGKLATALGRLPEEIDLKWWVDLLSPLIAVEVAERVAILNRLTLTPEEAFRRARAHAPPAEGR